MRTPSFLSILGIFAIVTAVGMYLYMNQVHEGDVRGIALLRADIDSIQSEFAQAGTSEDSARLVEEIASREYYYERRQFHVPQRQARLDRWWRPLGFGTMTTTFGIVLLVLAVVLRRRGGDVADPQ